MALESFFNDFAARELGDKFYFDNLDMLNPIAKIQLITKFIFGEELNTGGNLFRLVKKLFKLRNEYVHNKSKDAMEFITKYEMTEEDADRIANWTEEEIMQSYVISEKQKREFKNDISVAHDAVAAIFEVAKFFEQFRAGSGTMFFLIRAAGCGQYNREDSLKIEQVKKDFGVTEIDP